jgi:hypothetical protein
MSFWEKNTNQSTKPWEQPQPQVVLDEEAVQEMQESPEMDVFEEDDEDTSISMNDANLRLEQGRLYQMILKHDLFGETDADPKAIRNVQREIRRFVRERMETMLGIRQEQVLQQTIVSPPFNDMEVTVLKMLASKMSKGATEQTQAAPAPVPAPKKDGITSISGSLRGDAKPTVISTPTAPKPVAKQPVKNAPAQKPQQSALKTEDSLLQKPIDQMTQEELLAYNQAAEQRTASKYAKKPSGLTPHPSPQQLEAMYTIQASDRISQHAQRMTVINS